MSGEIEGVGHLATGALLAHAVDGDGRDGGGAGGLCLNCGTRRIGSHCHHCGQGGHIHRSIGAIWHEILHGVVHFEGKLWRTLPLLAFRPGELTRRYIDGERARFVSPMAMYLFSVFTLFAVLSILGVAPPSEISGNTAQVQAGIADQRNRLIVRRDRAVDTRDAVGTSEADRAEAERDIAEYDAEIAAIDQVQPVFGAQASGKSFKTGWARLDAGIEKADKNPGLMLYKLQANSYKFSWLLIPISIPFIWAMFAWRRQFRAYDHAVFATYSIAFMSILFIVLMLAHALGAPTALVATIGSLAPPLHIYRQLRGGYSLRRSRAAMRTFVLIAISIPIIVSLFLIAVVGLGFVG